MCFRSTFSSNLIDKPIAHALNSHIPPLYVCHSHIINILFSVYFRPPLLRFCIRRRQLGYSEKKLIEWKNLPCLFTLNCTLLFISFHIREPSEFSRKGKNVVIATFIRHSYVGVAD